MPAPVITRFAPSPTGFLHIGGARTALFNWLYAKASGGKMLLRIEDTDRARSTDEAIAAIIDGLTWLGLDWDGEPVSQYARAERHREVVEELLSSGHAYRCYCTPEELAEMREKALAEKRPMRYDGTWRDRDASEAPAGVAPAIRFRSPEHGVTVIDDAVQGRVEFRNEELDDLIILRSDGNPTYNLSVVVDDHDMGVTRIIRGVDHLTNAARQSQIYAALGWAVPAMTHIPLIHGPDGAKLSKRHGALGVDAYREMGFVPEALRNYLLRLGWGHGDDEIISTEQAIAWFDLAGVGKGASRFDLDRLTNLNAHYLRQMDPGVLADRIIPWLRAEGCAIDAAGRARLVAGMAGLKPRATTLVDLAASAKFYVANRPLALNEKATKLLDPAARERLGGLLPVLDALEGWDEQALEDVVRHHADAEGLKLGQVAQPLRAALTGSSTSPGIFEVMAVLGQQEVIARLADVVH